ncbi:superfamily II DNA/RNA helicases, SNF2 family [Bacillus sp. JCM 19046]|nr:superfamily II DNA/RNA helicases, SNF2 family [Bacillus sp. JCM 19046]
MKGIDQIIVLNAYRTVLYKGTFVKLKNEECTYLADLKKTLASSETHTIAVPQNKVGFFIERVVPGLKRLGEFHISEELSHQFEKTPLVAKLYLDRVKNRLLASLEFHYGHVMINPVDSSNAGAGLLLVRDEEKENTILELIEGSFDFERVRDTGCIMKRWNTSFSIIHYRKSSSLCKYTQQRQ